MQAAGIGAGGLQVHVVALDHHRLDALARQPVGEAGARDAAADHQRVDASRPAAARVSRGRAMSGGTKSLWPVHSGCSTRERADRHRLGRRARREQAELAHLARVVMRATTGGAVAALAAAHADAAGALQRRRRIVAGRDLAAQLARRHLLAAADDGVVVDARPARTAAPRTGATSAAWKRAARASAPARAPSASATARPRSRADRGGGDAPCAMRRLGAAEARAVADGEDLGARWCGRRRRSPSPSSRCRAARSDGAQPSARASSRRRGEAVAQRHDVGVDRQIAGLDPRTRSSPSRRVTRRPQCSSAAQPRRQRAGRSTSSAGIGRSGRQQARASCARPGARRRFEHRHDVGAAVEQLGRGLQAERAVAGDHDALARRHAVGARQRLQAADASSRRAGSSPAPAATARRRRSPARGAWAGTGSTRPATMAATSWAENAAHTVVSLRMRTPAAQRRLRAATAPSRNWRSSAGELGRVRGRQRLEDTGRRDAGARRPRSRRRRPAPARAPPTGRPGRRRPPARRRRSPRPARGRRSAARRRGRRGAHVHAGRDLGQAGALARPAVDRDQAVEADAHAAERPARRARARLAHGDDVRPPPAPRRWSRPAAPRSRARRSGGGPARRPAACRGASGAWQKVYNALRREDYEHEEVSRHLHRPDHALHGRRQEGRRGRR